MNFMKSFRIKHGTNKTENDLSSAAVSPSRTCLNSKPEGEKELKVGKKPGGNSLRLLVMALLIGMMLLPGCLGNSGINMILTTLQHIYQLKRGETYSAARRRANIEARKALMEEVKVNIPNDNGFIANLCIFDVVVNSQEKNDESNEIVTDLFTSLDMETFEARMNKLKSDQDYAGQKIDELQWDFDDRYEQILANEEALEESYDAWGGEQEYQNRGEEYYEWGGDYGSEEYYQECLDDYLESIDAVEETMSEAEEFGEQIFASISSDPDGGQGDPRQAFVDLINGNWNSKPELLDLLSRELGARDMMEYANEGIDDKEELRCSVISDFLGIGAQENNGSVQISRDDLTINHLEDNLVEIHLTEQACQRLYEVMAWFEMPAIGEYTGYDEETDVYEFSVDDDEPIGRSMNEMLSESLREPNYAVYEDGAWRIYKYGQ